MSTSKDPNEALADRRLDQFDQLVGENADLLRERDQLKAELAQARAHNAALIEACEAALAELVNHDRDHLGYTRNSVFSVCRQLRAAIALEKGEK